MIKCPNCGSAAQVKLIKEYWSNIAQSECKHYICGCGCDFQTEKWTNGIVHGYWCKQEGQYMIYKIKSYFDLNQAYEFNITDITALIYTICAIGVIMGADMTILFFIGATIATAFCWQNKRINLIILNFALWCMNAWGVIQMMMGGINV